MSLDTLKNDLQHNLSELAALNEGLASPADIVKHLKETLWPTIEAVVEELAEVDDCVADMVSGAEDILQTDTAAVFAAVIASSTAITAALKLRISREADPQLFKVCEEHEKNLKEASEILKDVVIDDGEDLEPDEDDDEDDDEDEDDDKEDA